MKVLRLLCLMVLLLTLAGLSGCAQTMHAIENAKMQVTVKMSDTVFLDAQSLIANRTVYLRVTNTSDMQEINFEPILRDKLAQKGITIVNDPSQAGYILQVNVLYMDYEKKGLTGDGMLTGGFGGALAGASLAGNRSGALAGATLGAMAGSLIGGAVGAAFKVEAYAGVIDVQIQEKVEGGVRGKVTTDASQGSATTIHTEREIKSNFQTYRTRVVAKAKQTNIDKEEAARIISDRLAQQVSGLF